MEDYTDVEVACKHAMAAAKKSPGRYGGRYVACYQHKPSNETVFAVLDDDDPDLYRDNEDLDIIAHVQPKIVHPLGRARYWLDETGKRIRE